MPPVLLLKRLILLVCFCRCPGILVVSYWPSAHYWPLLVERGGVADCLYVENGKDAFLHGGNKSSLFGSDNFRTPVLFLLLDGAVRESL